MFKTTILALMAALIFGHTDLIVL